MTKATFTLSILAQAKMALHSAKHGFSNPIHGIVVGGSTDDGGLEITDALPVCHEVPTKPLVDMALRLTEASLRLQSAGAGGEKKEGARRIVGWYTANANPAEDGLANISACRIAASIAEADADEEFVLLLISTRAMVENTLPMCTVFEKDKSRTFTQRVDKDRVITSDPDGGKCKDIYNAVKVLSEAVGRRSMTDNESDAAGGGARDSVPIHDFVDHMANCGEGDWIKNGAVTKFVLDEFS
ncbi:hypothetical protein ACHAWF_013755 [Thalassiosira exigua]